MKKLEAVVDAVVCEKHLQVIEHLAHHAVSLLHRAQATLETIQSLAREHSLPWAVDGAVRELDPEEVEAVKSACGDLIAEIREMLNEVGADEGDEPKGDEPKGDEPKGDEPKGDEPKGDEPKGDEPKGDEPKGDEPKGDELMSDDIVAKVEPLIDEKRPLPCAS